MFKQLSLRTHSGAPIRTAKETSCIGFHGGAMIKVDRRAAFLGLLSLPVLLPTNPASAKSAGNP